MKAWVSFIFRYILIGSIGITAIIFLVPTDKEEQQALVKLTRDKINLEQLDFSQLAVMIKSVTNNKTDEDLEVVQPINIADNIIQSPAVVDNRNNNGTPWGIVSASRASYYSRKGKFIGHLAPGTALNIIKITQTEKGSIAVCRPLKQQSASIILTNPERLTIRYNDVNSISKNLEHLYVQQAQLTAEVKIIKKQRSKELRRDNPHAKKYATCKKEYHDYWRKVKELTKKRDAATNEKQMNFADELRLMKGHDIRIANALEKVKSDYDNWNLSHPTTVNNDNEVNNLLAELTRIGKIISSEEKN